jgi:hypothetical protein
MSSTSNTGNDGFVEIDYDGRLQLVTKIGRMLYLNHAHIGSINDAGEIEFVPQQPNKLSIVVRYAQEGKTFICISLIDLDKSKNIHIVVTMNTINSNKQFLSRVESTIGAKRVIVFNSDPESAGECHHAKCVDEIFSLIRKFDIKVIICCAHDSRFKQSIPRILERASDSTSFNDINRKFDLHIDEAHAYIPQNREQIREFNNSEIVNNLIGYSASPDKIWELKKNDELFNKIYIRNIDDELDLPRSVDYFGVNRCEFIVIEDTYEREKLIEDAKIDIFIPSNVYQSATVNKKTASREDKPTWYGDDYYFDLGNEILLLSYVKHVLPKLGISQTGFSYNFVPAYMRLVTQYQMMAFILEVYPNANVVIVNGDGMVNYRFDINTGKYKEIRRDINVVPRDSRHEKQLQEPAAMIQELIIGYEKCPLFITGHTCVSMSVSLINESLGNFDNVVMEHHHLSDDKKYQFCRFLFNYMKWSEESKRRIKQTKFWSLTQCMKDSVLEYEQHIKRMSTEYVGRSVSLSEMKDMKEIPLTEKQEKAKALKSIVPENKTTWKQFKVYEGNDADEWRRAETFYETFLGKKLNGKSRPTDEAGFWHCSLTEKKTKQSINDIKHAMTKHGWHSTFQLKPGCLKYARVFVGYDNLEDPSEYTIYIKHVELPNNSVVLDILSKFCSKKTASCSNRVGRLRIEEDDDTSDYEDAVSDEDL